MSQVKQEASELYKETVLLIDETKNKYTEIINFINGDKKLKLDPDVETHLIKLTEMWENVSYTNMDHFYSMKDHHCYITNCLKNKTLSDMWRGYLRYSSEFRCNLMRLNELCSRLN